MNAENNHYKRLITELNALTEIAKTITSPLALPDLLDAVMKKIIGVLEQADIGGVMLWDQPSGLFRPIASFGYNFDILKEMGLRAGESITGKVFDEGCVRLLSTPEEVAQNMADMRPFNRSVMIRALSSEVIPHCVLAAPISVRDEKYGVLVLETIHQHQLFTLTDLPFIQILADLIALAIQRARLEAKADVVREARQAERLRAEVLGVLSHELRMPLATIKGYATALQLDEVNWSNEKQQEFLRLIDIECDDMQVMLKDILDSSLIDVDQLTIETQPLRLQNIARDVVTDLQRRTENHRILADFPPDFPILEGDSRWIKQVFRNILENAMKYSPDGGLIVIRGEIRAKDVVVMIADQGIGISPEDLIPLFEKYYRVRSTSNLHITGTGLGLPIARSIIEAHGGRIWVESKLGEGTTIYFSLPLPELSTD